MVWLWIVGIAIALLVLVFSSTATRNLVNVQVADDTVTIVPRALNRLWAFHGPITFPISSIKDVELVTGIKSLPTGMKFPGTAIPGLILAGTFIDNRERSFYAVRDSKNVVLFEIEGQRYAHIGIQTRDPQALVDHLKTLVPSAA